MDITDPKRNAFAVVLDTGEGFALKDAVTCMWMLKRGQVDEAIELYATGDDYGQMEQANAAAAKIEKAIRPIVRELGREIRRLRDEYGG